LPPITPTPESFDHAAELAAIARGSEQALQRLYRHEARYLLGVAVRIVRDRALAEDVLHDAFIAIWHKADSYDASRGEARGWIYSVVRHKALNLVRSNLRLVSADEEVIEAIEAEHAVASLADAFDIEADLGRLQGCLERLDVAKRNSILYAYVDGCTHGEIAQRLQSPLGTVKAWIKRGLASLKECMS
jgi:RNA polymerase sigma-70 factor (ECF subfamily)